MSPSPWHAHRLACGLLAATLVGAPVFGGGTGTAVTAREIIQVRDIGSIAVSPDGEAVAAKVYAANVELNRIRMEWQVVPLAGGAPLRVADAGDPAFGPNGSVEDSNLAGPPVWSRDSRWFYYLALFGAQVQVWRSARDGSRTERMTADEADVMHFGLEGEWLWYAVRATRAEILAAERQEYDEGTLLEETVWTQWPLAETREWNGRRTAMRGAPGKPVTLRGEAPWRFKLVGLTDGTVRLASEEEAARLREGINEAARAADHVTRTVSSPSGARIASTVLLPKSEGRRSLLPRRVLQVRSAAEDGETVRSCRAAAGTRVAGAVFPVAWIDERSLLFTSRSLAGLGLYLWDVPADTVREVFATDGDGTLGRDRYGNGVCELARGEVVGVLSGPALPPRLVAISVSTGATRVLLDPNPGLTQERLGEAEHLVVEDEFGNVATANLILPRRKEAPRASLVITDYYAHGFLRGGGGDDVPEHVLAGLGIVAACLNDNLEVEFSPLTFTKYREELSPTAPENLSARFDVSLSLRLALVRLLVARGLVDPGRVALTGMSGGADQVVQVLCRTQAFRAAVITTQTAYDPSQRWLLAASPRMHRRDENGKLVYDQTFYDLVSPAVRASRIATPLLMLPPECEYRGSLMLFGALRERGRPVEMVVYPDEFHIKVQPRHRLSVADRGTDWLRFWLQEWEDADVSKRGQYLRWRAMRKSVPDG